MTSKMRLWHGGARFLNVGDRITQEPGSKLYFFSVKKMARLFAAMVNPMGGALYEVAVPEVYAPDSLAPTFSFDLIETSVIAVVDSYVEFDATAYDKLERIVKVAKPNGSLVRVK